MDKGELLARAREATRATYGEEEEARGAIGASSSAAGPSGRASTAASRRWRARANGVRGEFRGGRGATGWRSRRARRLEREGSEEEAWEEAREARAAARETAARRPWDALRAIFAREKAPTNAISIDGMASRDFQATFDAMAMMYWVSERRTRRTGARGSGLDGRDVGDFLRASLGSRGGGVLSERGDARSGDSTSASSRGDEEARRPSVAGMACGASSIPSQKSAAAETKKDEEQARADASEDARARDATAKEDGSAESSRRR